MLSRVFRRNDSTGRETPRPPGTCIADLNSNVYRFARELFLMNAHGVHKLVLRTVGYSPGTRFTAKGASAHYGARSHQTALLVGSLAFTESVTPVLTSLMASLKSQTPPLQINILKQVWPISGPEFLRLCYSKTALFEARRKNALRTSFLAASIQMSRQKFQGALHR